MKHFAFVVECVISDTSKLFLVRNASNGQILRTASSPEDVARFLDETITSIKSA